MRAKIFQTGEIVLFQRDPGARWELGEYLNRVSPAVNDWHRVRDDTGFRVVHIVPPRRIKHSPAPRQEGVGGSRTKVE